MPTKPVSHSKRRRDRLNKKLKTKRHDAEAVKIRNSGRWQQLRALVLREEPLCRDPYGVHLVEGRIEPSAEVHHIIPLSTDPSKGYERENCAGLCVACHRRVDADNRAGKPTAHLFEALEARTVDVLKNEQKGGRGQS